MVSLPKMTLQELKDQDLTSNPTQPKENEQANKDLKVPTEKKEEEVKAADKDKVIEELSKKNAHIAEKEANKHEQDNKNQGNKKTLDELDRLIVSGNKLNKGTQTEKSARELNENERILSMLDSYGQTIGESVHNYWKLPKYLLNKNLKCRIRIYLSKRGDLLKFDLFESSNNKEFDQKAIEAIKSASPFTNPPSEIIDNIRSGELILGFPL
ncbi:MAG: TonB family protein [Oligoflexia bacterium]|nr:TonB family protein [Oligoflexia bacterium]